MLTLFLIAGLVILILLGFAALTFITGSLLFLFRRSRPIAPFVMLVPTLAALGAVGGSWGLGELTNQLDRSYNSVVPTYAYLLGCPAGAVMGFLIGLIFALWIRRFHGSSIN